MAACFVSLNLPEHNNKITCVKTIDYLQEIKKIVPISKIFIAEIFTLV